MLIYTTLSIISRRTRYTTMASILRYLT